LSPMTSDSPRCLSDAFIVAKTVTYVSSLPVTYVTTLYTLIARRFVQQIGIANGDISFISFGNSNNFYANCWTGDQ